MVGAARSDTGHNGVIRKMFNAGTVGSAVMKTKCECSACLAFWD